MKRLARTTSVALTAVHASLLVLLLTHPTFGQEEPTDPEESEEESSVSTQIWVDYDPSMWLSERWELYGDVGFRTELQSNGWVRFVVRPNVRYTINDIFRLAGGIGSFYTNNTEEGVADRWELRPWQGVRVNWPTWRLKFDHFLRFEERFEWDTREWDLDASLRIRYRLRTSYRWAAFLRDERYWQALASAEVFGAAGNEGQFQEQLRLGLGLERSFSRRVRLRLEVVWQKVGSFFGGPVNDIYIRVRVFHGWD